MAPARIEFVAGLNAPVPVLTAEAAACSTQSESSWDVVASELRACKQEQQRAWGNVDSSDLGRYLAGELAGDELSDIEQQLADLPELRKLTDLVRGVLDDLEPVSFEEPAASAIEEPVVLQFPKAVPARRWPRIKRYASLAAAACLLITLGVWSPRPGYLSAPATEDFRMSAGTASRDSVIGSAQFFAPRFSEQNVALNDRQLADAYQLALNSPLMDVKSGSRMEKTHLSLAEEIATQPVAHVQAQVVPILAKAVQTTTDCAKRRSFVRAIGQLGPVASPALPVLAARLESTKDPLEAKEVLDAIDRMGHAGKSVVKVLVAYSNDESRCAKDSAYRVLTNLRSNEGQVGIMDHANCLSCGTLAQGTETLRRLARDKGVVVVFETVTGKQSATVNCSKELGSRFVHFVLRVGARGEQRLDVRVSERLAREGLSPKAIQTSLTTACHLRDTEKLVPLSAKVIDRLVPIAAKR